MIKRMDIISATGNPMRVVLIPANEQRPNFTGAKPVSKSLIEFYDGRYPHTPDGQFICEYYTDTILETPRDSGLILFGGEPDWKIDAPTKNLVRDWLVDHFTPSLNT